MQPLSKTYQEEIYQTGVYLSLPALLKALNEWLVERCILGNGLDDAPFNRHMANSPLAHSCAAQAKDIAAREGRK